jgi:hypothetical protein
VDEPGGDRPHDEGDGAGDAIEPEQAGARDDECEEEDRRRQRTRQVDRGDRLQPQSGDECGPQRPLHVREEHRHAAQRNARHDDARIARDDTEDECAGQADHREHDPQPRKVRDHGAALRVAADRVAADSDVREAALGQAVDHVDQRRDGQEPAVADRAQMADHEWSGDDSDEDTDDMRGRADAAAADDLATGLAGGKRVVIGLRKRCGGVRRHSPQASRNARARASVVEARAHASAPCCSSA